MTLWLSGLFFNVIFLGTRDSQSDTGEAVPSEGRHDEHTAKVWSVVCTSSFAKRFFEQVVRTGRSMDTARHRLKECKMIAQKLKEELERKRKSPNPQKPEPMDSSSSALNVSCVCCVLKCMCSCALSTHRV